ncbi:transcription antitermination factor NusB [bacterium]|nr:transcription antitermination factor NusB [bacterium]
MLPRRKSRILALCMLYALDMQRTDDLSVSARVENIFSRPFPQSVTDYARSLVTSVVRNAESIDELIFRHTHNWDKERIAMVDRQIMRIAICEFSFKRSAPAVVAINEAVAVAKIFGTEESGRFVNGILDAVNVEVNNLVREEQTREEAEEPAPEAPKEEKPKIIRSAYLAKYAKEATILEKEKEARRAAIEAEREAEREERRKAREAEREARRAQREAEQLEEEY